MKNVRRIAALLLVALPLASCGGETGGGSGSASKPTILRPTFDTIEEKLALHSTITDYYAGEEGWEEASVADTYSVYTPNYMYYEETRDGSWGYSRFDKSESGYLVTASLDPLTNEVVEEPVSVNGNYTAYDDFFSSPFPYTEDLFDVIDTEDGGIAFTLAIPEYFPAETFANITMLGSGGLSLISLDLAYDGSAITAIDAVYEDDWGWQRTTFHGEVISGSDVDVVPYPTAVPEAEGQDALTAKLAEIRELNYTLSVKATLGEEELNCKLSMTPTGYYTELDPSMHENDFDSGRYDTPNGSQKFINRDGVLEDFNLPLKGYSNQTIYGAYWSFTGNVFEVADDGSYVLPAITGLYEAVSTSLLHESFNFFVGGTPDAGSLRLKIEGEDLVYTYTCETWDGPMSIEGRVSNIGTTTLPVDVSTATPYVPSSTWTEYLTKEWLEDGLDALAALTGDEPDVVPFHEIGMGYNMECITRSYSYPDGNEVEFFHSFSFTAQVADTAQAVDYYDLYVADLLADSHYVYDAFADKYVYTVDGAPVFSVKLTILSGVQTYVGVMDFCLDVTVTNENEPEPPSW